MPLFLYPLLGIIFVSFFRMPTLLLMSQPVYRVALREADKMLLVGYLSLGEHSLQREQGFEPAPSEGKQLPLPHIQILPGLIPIVVEDLEEAVQTGQADIAIRLTASRGLFQFVADGNKTADWELIYVDEFPMGVAAARYLLRLAAAANEDYLAFRLNGPKVIQRIPPVKITATVLTAGQDKRSSALAALLPLVLVLMTMTGAVYPSIDLTAGERERGTMEILMAAPIPRLSLLLAKYFAVVTVALLTALMNLGVMTATLFALGLGKHLFTSTWAFTLVLVEVLGLLVLFAAFFAAVLLTITSVARSFKEAQAYLIPLMILALAPAVVSLLPGLNLQGVYFYVPLLNIVLLSRDLLDGRSELLPTLLVVSVTALYALIALALAARIFGRSSFA